jgi:hypothetical protein
MVAGQQRTLGELELVSAKVDTRYSLAAKIFGWSEAEFWQNWYLGYKTHFKDKIDKKMVRLAGVWGPEVRPFAKGDLIGKVDPDIIIESRVVAEATLESSINRIGDSVIVEIAVGAGRFIGEQRWQGR